MNPYGRDPAQSITQTAGRFVGKCVADVTAGTAKSKRAAGRSVCDRGKPLERLIGEMPPVCHSGTGF